MKFLLLIAVAISFMIFVVGVPGLLSVDDLAKCDKPSSLESGCEKADAIIAISGGDTEARTAEAVKLYKQGWASKLIFSGAALDPQSPSNASAMRAQALREGVPKRAILLDENSDNTAENASLTRSLVGDGQKRIILVTSPYHQRRAGIEFSRHFSPDIEVVNHPTPNDRYWPSRWWTSLSGWLLAFSESIKTIITIAKP